MAGFGPSDVLLAIEHDCNLLKSLLQVCLAARILVSLADYVGQIQDYVFSCAVHVRVEY